MLPLKVILSFQSDSSFHSSQHNVCQTRRSTCALFVLLISSLKYLRKYIFEVQDLDSYPKSVLNVYFWKIQVDAQCLLFFYYNIQDYSYTGQENGCNFVGSLVTWAVAASRRLMGAIKENTLINPGPLNISRTTRITLLFLRSNLTL